MKKEVNPILIGAILVLVVGTLGYFGWKVMSPAEPRAGSYTPGLPPWMDPKSPEYKKGQGGPTGGPTGGAPGAPGGTPSGGAPSAPPQGNSSGG
ncbi:MAG: hypothetical protein JWL77_6696 [Chthonomonadaceae bacterium]|nr:hypothetical protein [Chthonomonadaceae bacterium]